MSAENPDYGSFAGAYISPEVMFPEGIYQEATLVFVNPGFSNEAGIMQRLGLKFINAKDEVVWLSQLPTKKNKAKGKPDLLYFRDTIKLLAEMAEVPYTELANLNEAFTFINLHLIDRKFHISVMHQRDRQGILRAEITTFHTSPMPEDPNDEIPFDFLDKDPQQKEPQPMEDNKNDSKTGVDSGVDCLALVDKLHQQAIYESFKLTSQSKRMNRESVGAFANWVVDQLANLKQTLTEGRNNA